MIDHYYDHDFAKYIYLLREVYLECENYLGSIKSSFLFQENVFNYKNIGFCTRNFAIQIETNRKIVLLIWSTHPNRISFKTMPWYNQLKMTRRRLVYKRYGGWVVHLTQLAH